MKISLVIPCHNEESSLSAFFKEILPVIDSIPDVEWELVFVDDGSTDNTLGKLTQYAAQDGRIHLIGLSRCFGKEAALTAGMDVSTGDAVIPMDADLQDPPFLLGEMVSKHKEGWPVVQAVRRCRASDGWLKRTTARLFYSVMKRLVSFDLQPNAGDFQLLSREVIDAIKCYPERTRFLKGIAACVGFPRTQIYFDRPHRSNGRTKFSILKLWNFALDGITSFSTLPLRIWSYVGVMVATFSFLWAAWLVIRTLVFGVVTPGYASIYATVLFIGGLQLLGIGIIGEYIGRTSIEVRNRPIYHIAFKSRTTNDSRQFTQKPE